MPKEKIDWWGIAGYVLGAAAILVTVIAILYMALK